MKDRFPLSYDLVAFLFQMHEPHSIHEGKGIRGFSFFDVSVLSNWQGIFKKVPNHISYLKM
ncbi:hypothetical protein ABXV22_08735 [Vibrio rotiferianus]